MNLGKAFKILGQQDDTYAFVLPEYIHFLFIKKARSFGLPHAKDKYSSRL